MITFVKIPAIMKSFSLIGYDWEQRVSSPGRLALIFSMKTDRMQSDLTHIASLQAALAEPVICEIGECQFHGVVSSVQYHASTQHVVIICLEYLADLKSNYRSRIYVDRSIADILRQLETPSLAIRVEREYASINIKLMVQYQESDYAFLCRLAAYVGAIIWTVNDEVYFGRPSTNTSKEIVLNKDLFQYQIKTKLVPSTLALTPLSYKDEQSDSIDIVIDSGSAGPVHDKVADKCTGLSHSVVFHTTIEDSNYDSPEILGAGLLQCLSDRNLEVTGYISKPQVKIGQALALKEPPGGSTNNRGEKVIVESIRIRWQYEKQEKSFKITAVSPESLRTQHDLLGQRLHMATALVKETNEEMNRVKIAFPWDPEHTTPYLRMLSPYWGQDHQWYAPPAVDDAVLVIWGQADHDPVVIGGIAYGNAITDDKDAFLINLGNTRKIVVSENMIELKYQSGQKKSAVSISPEKVIIDSEKIELKARSIDVV